MSDNKLFNVDSETSILGGVLNTPSLVHATDGLRFYMFSSSPHQNLFQEFEQLKEQQLSPTPELVIASLESKNMIDKVGGKNYIETLLKKSTDLESFQKFVEIVVLSYKARTYISLLAVKKDDLNAENINEKIDGTRRGLEELIGMGGGNHTIHLSEIANQTYNEIMSRIGNPGIRGASWGVKSIDTVTGGKSPGDLVIVAGRPGSGKTSVFLNSIYADAVAEVPSLLISREMRPQELMERLISIDTAIPSTSVRLGMMTQENVNQIKASFEKLSKLPIYLDFNFRVSDPFYLESTITKFKNQKGIQNVYLDYIQIATERDENQTQEIGRLTRMFKQLSNSLNICSLLASQLNRGVEARDDKRPLLSDMRQSGAIEEDADFVIGLYRDEYYHPETKAKGLMEYIILKHRNGPPGTVTVGFDGPTYRIREA